MKGVVVFALSLLGAAGLSAQTMHYDMADWVAARLKPHPPPKPLRLPPARENTR